MDAINVTISLYFEIKDSRDLVEVCKWSQYKNASVMVFAMTAESNSRKKQVSGK